jgi:hypothetical protein
MRTAKTPERTNNRKKRVTLLGVIANGSTSDARKLLMKYDEPDAKNHDDLEYRLTKLYQKAPDKIQFEKELSAIHPHKDFILKYNSPVPELTEIPKEVIDITKQMATNPEDYSTSNCCGNSSFGGKSCACGCGKSNLTGSANDPIQSQNASGLNAGMMMMGMLGIITIFALTIRNK